MTNVLVVEDQRMARERLEAYIRESGRYRLAWSIPNASLAEMYCLRGGVDLVLMDVCTARDESGLEAAAQIKKTCPHVRVIVVTSMPECSFLDKARAAGAESFWYKDAGQQEILEVMDRTMAGETVYPDRTPEVAVGEAGSYEFTDRELDVLRELAKGCTYREMAEHLFLSQDTVKYHVTNLLSKTGYDSKTKLAVAVVNKKLILPDY